MKYLSLAGVLVIFFCFIFSGSCSKGKDGENNDSLVPISAMEDSVLILVNAYRVSLGIPELEMDSLMREEARTHSENMGLGRIPLGHSGFSGRADRIQARLGAGNMGENVESGPSNVDYAVDVWLSSAGHKANIEGAYTLTGIGVVLDSDSLFYYYTQIFLQH
jgi:uncharacterized protein YkwD